MFRIELATPLGNVRSATFSKCGTSLVTIRTVYFLIKYPLPGSIFRIELATPPVGVQKPVKFFAAEKLLPKTPAMPVAVG